MLVLKRGLHQVLRIGPDVLVEVVKIERGVVTLGVTAPPQWRIRKLDLDQAIRSTAG